MIRLVIGFVLGVLAYHYYPDQIRDAAAKTGEIVHEGAAKAAEITKPQSEIDKFLEKVK